ncbi:DUF1573 domain-containing protein [bacterium]|nr:MAG: DUF1573 domain-containing protein [bacterium]
MKKCYMLLALSVLFFWISCSHAQDKVNSSLEAQDDPRYVWDSGKVSKSEILEHTFILPNDSRYTLKIKNVQTSCSCTTAEIKNKILRQGENIELKVKVKLKGYKGEVKQYIFVYTDSLDNPILRFIIKAEVK